MSKFLEKYRSSYKQVATIPNLELARPVFSKSVAGDIGLELEIEGQNLPTTGYLEKLTGKRSGAEWSIHQDGSLRGEAAEYVLTTPCFPDEVDDLVLGLYKVFEGRRSVLNLSNRCSTHVHVNVGGLKINELTSLIALWSTFEEALINWCGEERTSNHFCLSMKDSSQLVDTWNSVLQGNGFNFSEGMKYSALNVRTLRTIGSYEFRCMRACESPFPIIDWAKAMVGFRNYTVQNFQNPQDIAGRLSEFGGTNILGTILQESGCTSTFLDEILRLDKNQDFEGMALRGLRRAQPIILGHPWTALLPEIQKVEIVDPFASQTKKMRFSSTIPEWEPAEGDNPFQEQGRRPPGEGRIARTTDRFTFNNAVPRNVNTVGPEDRETIDEWLTRNEVPEPQEGVVVPVEDALFPVRDDPFGGVAPAPAPPLTRPVQARPPLVEMNDTTALRLIARRSRAYQRRQGENSFEYVQRLNQAFDNGEITNEARSAFIRTT